MRLLFWSDVFWPHIGGLAVWAARYSLALAERGHEVRVLTPQLAPGQQLWESFHGLPVHRLPLWAAFHGGDAGSLRDARRLVEALCRDWAPEAVQLSPALGAPSLLLFVVSPAMRLPTLLTLHDDWPARHTLPGSPLDQVVRRAGWVTAFSAASLAWLHGRWPELEGRSSAIRHAMALPPQPASIPCGPPRIAFVGRLCRVKGVDMALAAFAMVLHAFPQARLVLAGDGPERAGFEQDAARLGIAASVDFLGWVEPAAVGPLLESAVLAIVPSRSEPFGLVALEAACHGRPVVASRVGGLAEQVLDGTTGILCPPEDAEDLAAAITSLLADPSRARALGAAARHHAEHGFTWPDHVMAFERLIQALADP